MPQPTLGDVHVNRPLTMMSVGFLQDQKNFVADQVFPGVPVPNKSDSYFLYNRGDFFRDEMQMRADGDPAAGAGYKLATDTYVAEVWALLKKIGDQVRANSDSPLQPDRDAVAFLTQKGLLNREVQWVLNYFNTNIWGYERAGAASTNGTTTVQYWNQSGSDPIADILDAALSISETTGYKPNTLVLSARVKRALKRNPVITDLLKYGQTPGAPVQVRDTDLAALFEVDRVLTMQSTKTTSAPNMNNNSDTLPDTFSFIAGKHAGLFYVAPSPGLMVPSAGYTFNWTGLTGGTAGGYRIKKYRWEVNAADHVEIDSAYAQKMVSKYLGAFFYNVVQ